MPRKQNKPDLRLPKRPVDPTGTAGLRQTYRREIYGLFKKFSEHLEPRIVRLLKRSDIKLDTNDYITPGFLKEFIEKIEEVESSVIRAGSPSIINKIITLAFKRGKQVASSNPRLRYQSITIPSVLSRTDNLALEDLKIRNFNLINDDTIKKKLLQIITEDIRTGEGIDKMVRDIRNNVIDIGKARAKMIARTETAFSYNTAVAKTYRDAGIEKWQWFSALIDTTCAECSSRHGNVYDWGDEQPPLHPNCYCSIYPVVDKEFKP